MIVVPTTKSPFAATKFITVRITLSRAGSIRQRKLLPAPPVLPPRSLPVLLLVHLCPVVHTGVAGTVVVPGAAVAPLAAARFVAGPVTLARETIVQGEGRSAATVSSDTTLHQWHDYSRPASEINTARAVTVIWSGSTVSKLAATMVGTGSIALTCCPVV